MNATWAAEISKDFHRELAQLRLLPGVELAETSSSVWLRGKTSLEEAQAALGQIPHVRLYLVEAAGLRLQGHLLVSRTWPGKFSSARSVESNEQFVTAWQPLIEGIAVELPRAGYATGAVPPLTIRLVRSLRQQRSTLLITIADSWLEFAASAPKVRLDRLTFAISEDSRVLVLGEPLPPLPGQQFWDVDGNLIPIGWMCSPNLDGQTLSLALGRDRNEYLLFSEDGSVESIPMSSFVPATRAAVRSSLGSGTI